MSGAEKQWEQLGAILIEQGLVTQEQLHQALLTQAQSMLPLASTFIEMHLVSEADVARALSTQFGVPSLDIHQSVVATSALDAVPFDVAYSHYVLPLEVGADTMKVAFSTPDDRTLLDEIAFGTGKKVLAFVVPRIVLEEVISQAYAAKKDGEDFWRGKKSSAAAPHLEQLLPFPRGKGSAGIPEVEHELPATLPSPVDTTTEDMTDEAKVPRVLVVDDEPEILDLVEKALTHRGMEVIRADRGRLALEKLQTHPPDLVLLDAMLPEIHGFEICNKIKRSQQYRDIPVMIISAIYTGWNFTQDVKRIYGADGYMSKPFRIMELVRQVEALLEKRKGEAPSRERASVRRKVEQCLRDASEALKAADIETSLQHTKEAVKANPFDPRCHFLLGSTLHRAGHVYEAISEYERVIELAPTEFNALKNLAVLYERQGFKSKAVEMWTRALAESPSDAVRKTIKAHLFDLL